MKTTARPIHNNPNPSYRSLGALLGRAAQSLLPVLARRNQRVLQSATVREAHRAGDQPLVRLIEAALRDVAGLSAAGASLRIVCDRDEGDQIITIVGANSAVIPPEWITLNRAVGVLARRVGAEADLIWEAGEGPTLVLRLPTHRDDYLEAIPCTAVPAE